MPKCGALRQVQRGLRRRRPPEPSVDVRLGVLHVDNGDAFAAD